MGLFKERQMIWFKNAWCNFWFAAGPADNAAQIRRLKLFRIAFFTCIALERGIMSQQWARGNTGDFYMSHADWFFVQDGLWDFRPSAFFLKDVVYFMCLVLATACVADVFYPVCSFLLALFYNYGYFSTMADGFQHHYLIACILWIMPFVDYENPTKNTWPLRLCSFQLASVYFWAAIAKMDSSFLMGTVVQRQLAIRGLYDLITNISIVTNVEEWILWRAIAWSTVALELYIAFGWIVGIRYKKMRTLSFILGMVFHIGLQCTGKFKIGLFSFYMVSFYILLFPETVFGSA